MTKPAIVELITDGQRAAIAPAIGGALVSYCAVFGGKRVDLVRKSGALRAGHSVLELACFPLVPYSSRIRHGRFRFEGRDIRLPLNFGTHPHSIHGHGWQRPWTVAERDTRALTLDYHHAPDAWPWAYQARQVFALIDGGLSLTLMVTNRSDSTMPIGLGFHPYFPRGRQARLTANVAAVWLMDEEVMPVERAALPAALDLPGGMALHGSNLDNCFEGWDGVARIAWPHTGVGLDLTASTNLARLVVYAPKDMDFFCVEPVSNVTDAFNRAAAGDAETGMSTLAPGESIAASMRLTPRALG